MGKKLSFRILQTAQTPKPIVVLSLGIAFSSHPFSVQSLIFGKHKHLHFGEKTRSFSVFSNQQPSVRYFGVGCCGRLVQEITWGQHFNLIFFGAVQVCPKQTVQRLEVCYRKVIMGPPFLSWTWQTEKLWHHQKPIFLMHPRIMSLA